MLLMEHIVDLIFSSVVLPLEIEIGVFIPSSLRALSKSESNVSDPPL
jgi:hypothetical protein